MNRSILILLFIFIILAGCTRPTESHEKMITEIIDNEDAGEALESIDKVIDLIVTEEVNQEEISDGEIKAEKAAQEFVQIIKKKDEVKLLQFLNTTRLDLAGAKKIIEGFNINFDLD